MRHGVGRQPSLEEPLDRPRAGELKVKVQVKVEWEQRTGRVPKQGKADDAVSGEEEDKSRQDKKGEEIKPTKRWCIEIHV